jgi:hypothetical protein
VRRRRQDQRSRRGCFDPSDQLVSAPADRPHRSAGLEQTVEVLPVGTRHSRVVKAVIDHVEEQIVIPGRGSDQNLHDLVRSGIA